MDTVIARLNAAGARYMVIGGQAVRLHGLPRFTMDWDFFIPPHDIENLKRIELALEGELDIDLVPLGRQGENAIQTYQTRWGVLQFHLAVPGVPSFEEAERRAVKIETEDGDLAPCLCLEDLIRAKVAANRPQDQQDIEFLKELLRHRSSPAG